MNKSILRIISLILVFSLAFCFWACEKKYDTLSDKLETKPVPDGSTSSTEALLPEKASIKNVIIIIGDGMGSEQIEAGEYYAGKSFGFKSWSSAKVDTNSLGVTSKATALTDSAAAGTALATGTLTSNGRIGMNKAGEELSTVLDVAASLGKSTGVVTTDALTGATPSAFSAHSLSRNNSEEIFESQLNSGVDLLCGTTNSLCTSNSAKIKAAGYTYCDNFQNIDSTLKSDKTYWQFSLGGTSAKVKLCDVSVKALDYLDQDEDGFVLMIEQAYVDKYAHSNEIHGMVKSVKSLNDTVEAVLAWLGERTDTAIIITADHETGGFSVSEEAEYSKPYACNGRTVYYQFTTGDHTKTEVDVFVYGIEPVFSDFTYYSDDDHIKNTNIFDLMNTLLAEPTKYSK